MGQGYLYLRALLHLRGDRGRRGVRFLHCSSGLGFQFGFWLWMVMLSLGLRGDEAVT